MLKLFIKRLLLFLPQVFILSLIVFFLSDGGLGFGQQDSIFVRYWNWLNGVVRIITIRDFGWSPLIQHSLLNTLRLSLLALLLVYGIGIPLGIISGRHFGTLKDRTLQMVTLIGASLPSFTLALILLLFIGFRLGWLPTGGSLPPGMSRETVSFSTYHIARLRHMMLPALSLAIVQIIVPMKYLRGDIIDTYHREYITLARSKGASEKHLFKKHIFKNSLSSTISSVPIQMAAIVTGSIIIEMIFAFPGMGGLLFWAFQFNDVTLVGVLILIIGLVILVGAFISDIILMILNPQTKIEE